MSRYSLENVRPEILEQYYHTTYGIGIAQPRAFAGTTPDEYVALSRIQTPEASARGLLAWVHSGHREAAGDAPGEEGRAPVPLWESVPDTSVDLADPALADKKLRCAGVSISVSGEPTPSRVWLSKCGAPEPVPEATRFDHVLDELSITRCSRACVELATTRMRARLVSWYEDDTRVNTNLLKGMDELVAIDIRATLIDSLRGLSERQLETATLVRVTGPEDLRDGLSGSRSSLRELTTTTVEPLRPRDITDFSKLARLRIAADRLGAMASPEPALRGATR